MEPKNPESNHPEPTNTGLPQWPAETLFDFAAGTLDEAATRAVKRDADADAELAARVNFMRMFVEDDGPPDDEHEQIGQLVGEVVAGQQSLPRNRDVVNEVLARWLCQAEFASPDHLAFFHTAGMTLRRTIHERAATFDKQSNESESTVQDRVAESTLRLGESQPFTVMMREKRLAELEESDAVEAVVFLLNEFAGRTTDEIAGLLGRDVDDVLTDLTFARVAVIEG